MPQQAASNASDTLFEERAPTPSCSTPNDHAAIQLISKHGGALCTLVHVEGSYSRRLGAQLAIAPNGSMAGELADHCLEAELANRARHLAASASPQLLVYGNGSPFIDFRLPCGSTIHILLDPNADQLAARHITADLNGRQPASLRLRTIKGNQYAKRDYLPALRILAFGEGPESIALMEMAAAYGANVEIVPANISAAQMARLQCDQWTAVICLSHDHEWERAILPWALTSDAFYVGAIGGRRARTARLEMLHEQGLNRETINRLTAPIGVTPSTRHPSALALSALAEIAASYEEMLDG